MKLTNKKGFTLMEMLIVVAIIAILIAIAIPVFGAQLEKAAEATDAANIRAAYAEAMVALIDDKSFEKSNSLRQTKDNWQDSGLYNGLSYLAVDSNYVTATNLNAPTKGGKWTVKVDNGSVTITLD